MVEEDISHSKSAGLESPQEMLSNDNDAFIFGLKVSRHTLGTIYCIVGVLALTPDSLMLRKVSNVPSYTVLFYRYLSFALTAFLTLVLTQKGETWRSFKQIGLWGVATGLILGVSNICITLGFLNTAAANVLVIYSSNPVFSALFSWLLMREKIPLRTILTSLVCLGAIALIFSSELGGSSDGNDLAGLLFAFGSSISLGLFFVLLRMVKHVHKCVFLRIRIPLSTD